MHIPSDHVYREPFAAWPTMQTYVLHVSQLCQFQWDYVFEWSEKQEPTLRICSYRCFQRADPDDKFEQVDQTPFDIPIWHEVLVGITQNIASAIYKSARIIGSVQSAPSNYSEGAAEAADKRYDMCKYRSMMVTGNRFLK